MNLVPLSFSCLFPLVVRVVVLCMCCVLLSITCPPGCDRHVWAPRSQCATGRKHAGTTTIITHRRGGRRTNTRWRGEGTAILSPPVRHRSIVSPSAARVIDSNHCVLHGRTNYHPTHATPDKRRDGGEEHLTQGQRFLGCCVLSFVGLRLACCNRCVLPFLVLLSFAFVLCSPFWFVGLVVARIKSSHKKQMRRTARSRAVTGTAGRRHTETNGIREEEEGTETARGKLKTNINNWSSSEGCRT